MKNSYSVCEVNSAVTDSAEAFVAEGVSGYEKQVAAALDNILKDSRIDIVMLAGPSSSGKTTTAEKLCDGIRSSGRNAYNISLDDFYFDRDKIPFNSDGLPDFENITALDIPLIEKTFDSLINEREAVIPFFNFQTGKREEGRLVHIGKDDVIVVEGIHALNPVIIREIDHTHIHKIYISVSSCFTDEKGNTLLSQRDIRFIRRMLRDYQFRASEIEKTFFLWKGVLKGEEEFIFPYKNEANEFINSVHPFEECLFQKRVRPLLSHIDERSAYYNEARRLYEALALFEHIEEKYLPKDSLLREFIG